jgi:hypothetical protein
MSGNESVEELQQEERACLAKFRQRASELRAQHSDWSSTYSFSKACESLPKTLSRYMWVQQMLQSRGVASLPLR